MRVRGVSIDLDIDVRKLARRSSALQQLRIALVEQAGGDLDRVDRFLKRRLDEAFSAFGEQFVAATSPALQRIAGLREELTQAYDRALAGEQELHAATLRELFDDLQTQLDSLRSPTGWAKANGLKLPPIDAPSPSRAPDPTRRGRIVRALAGRLRDLATLGDQRGRDALLDAAEEVPDQVRAAVVAETESGLDTALDDLEAELKKKGWGPDKIRRCLTAVRRLQAGRERSRRLEAEAVRRRAVQASLARLPADLAKLIRNSKFLQSFLPGGEDLLSSLFQRYREGRARRGVRRLKSPTFEAYVLILRRLYRGQHGEFQAAWKLGDDFIVLKAPDGKPTIRGTDLVVVKLDTGEIWFVDNKAFEGDGEIASVTALMRNFPRNILTDVFEFAETFGDEPVDPVVADALDRIALAAFQINEFTGEPPGPARDAKIEAILRPLRIARVVTSAEGNSSGISDALKASGLQHVDVNRAEPLVDDREVMVP